MRGDYQTVRSYGESEYIIQKSRFLTYVKRTETEEEAIDFINEIKRFIIMRHIIVLPI